MKSLLELLSLVLLVCGQISFGYAINYSDNKSPKLVEDSFKMNLFEYTFDNSVLVQPNDDFTFVGSSYLSLPSNYKYKPDPNNDETITLTDFTSITQATSNGQSCMLPFQANGMSNFFCVDKQDATNSYECQTVAGFGDCKLGKFMQVKRTETGNYITAIVSFKTPVLFNATASYELVLNYLLNVDICNRDNYSMIVYIANKEFNQLIFSLNDAKDDTNDKWNEARIEFEIEQTGEAYLLVQIDGYCATAVNDAFIAIDNIELNQFLQPIISTTTTSVPTTTTTTMALTSIETLASTRLSSTSKGPTEASTEHETNINTHESSRSTKTTTTIKEAQSTPDTTEPSKGVDILLIVLLSTLIPISLTVFAIGVIVFIYFYKWKRKRPPTIKPYDNESYSMKVG